MGISIDWLVTGRGEMHRDGESGMPAGLATQSPREEALLALFRELDEDGQREIQGAAQAQKRLKILEQRVEQLADQIADNVAVDVENKKKIS